MGKDVCLKCMKNDLSEDELLLYKAGKLEVEYSGTGICPACMQYAKLTSSYSYNTADLKKLKEAESSC